METLLLNYCLMVEVIGLLLIGVYPNFQWDLLTIMADIFLLSLILVTMGLLDLVYDGES